MTGPAVVVLGSLGQSAPFPWHSSPAGPVKEVTMAQNKGNIARELAHAPLHTESVPSTAMGAAMADAIIGQMQEKQAESIKPVTLPFTLSGFKLNGKAKDYPSDDDPTIISRKVAFAVLAIGDSGFRFQASIYRVTHSAIKDDKGRVKVATRCTMPNAGKMGGFKTIIETDDPREQRALDEFKAGLVRQFRDWLKETSGIGAVQAKGTSHADEFVEFE